MMILMATGSRIKNKIESPVLKSRLASAAKMSPNTACRRTVYHHWRARVGRFFGEPGDCIVLDTTWNTGMSLFLFVLIGKVSRRTANSIRCRDVVHQHHVHAPVGM